MCNGLSLARKSIFNYDKELRYRVKETKLVYYSYLTTYEHEQ